MDNTSGNNSLFSKVIASMLILNSMNSSINYKRPPDKNIKKPKKRKENNDLDIINNLQEYLNKSNSKTYKNKSKKRKNEDFAEKIRSILNEPPKYPTNNKEKNIKENKNFDTSTNSTKTLKDKLNEVKVFNEKVIKDTIIKPCFEERKKEIEVNDTNNEETIETSINLVSYENDATEPINTNSVITDDVCTPSYSKVTEIVDHKVEEVNIINPCFEEEKREPEINNISKEETIVNSINLVSYENDATEPINTNSVITDDDCIPSYSKVTNLVDDKPIEDNIIKHYSEEKKSDTEFNNINMKETLVSSINIDSCETSANRSTDIKNPLSEEKVFTKENRIKSKLPVFLESKVLKFPIKMEAEVEDKILEIENINYKVIKFNPTISKDKENDENSKKILIYDGVLRAIVKYIYFDKKVGNIATANYKMVILYMDFSGFSEIQQCRINKENKVNDINVDFKNSDFYASHIFQNEIELEELGDTVYNKFKIIGEGVINIDVLLETYLTLLV
ncbi:MAG: hypothetical protein AB6733_04350 [Clostridiaceae bacterium]